MKTEDIDALLKEQDEAHGIMTRLLPAWFVDRMAGDTWYFGMKLITGEMLGVSTLNEVHVASGMVWLDVELLNQEDVAGLGPIWRSVTAAPTSRVTASINAAHVVYVVELADT